MESVHRVDHSLVDVFVSRLRDKDTDPATFRATARRLSLLLAYEATKGLRIRQTKVQTPLAVAAGSELIDRVGLIPILRAGLGMVDAVLDLVPDAEVWHLGFYRDEKTLKPVEYYKKLPGDDPVDVALVLDPMLATGGSAVAALGALQEWGVRTVKLLALIAAPPGIERVLTDFPGTSIHVCSIDSHLNEHGYIVPGLGDAGDRIFNARAH